VIAELIGSFLFTFIHLSQHDKKTKVSEDVIIFSLVVASTYMASISLSSSTSLGYSPLNPAIAIGIYFSQVFTGSTVDGLWIQILMPFVGGLCASLFFEIIFKKTVIHVK